MANLNLIQGIATTTTIFLLSLFLSPTFTTADPIPVLDIQGNPLQVGTSYHILPISWGAASGGLSTVSVRTTPDEPCTFYVGQSHPLTNGRPLKFYPVNLKQIDVHESSDLNIVFNSFINFCMTPVGWRLTLDPLARRSYVTTGGSVGSSELSVWFQIKKAEIEGSEGNYYKIVFCPEGSDDGVACANIGVLRGEGENRRLGITDEPIVVYFQKVDDSQSIKMVA